MWTDIDEQMLSLLIIKKGAPIKIDKKISKKEKYDLELKDWDQRFMSNRVKQWSKKNLH